MAVLPATILKNMPDGVLVLDNNGFVVDLNPAARQVLNLEPAQVVGRDARQLFPELADLFELTGTPLQEQREISLNGKAANHYYELRLSTLYDDRQTGCGYLLTLRDITGHKEADLTKSRQLDWERLRRRESEALREAVLAMVATLNLDEVLDQILIHLAQVISYDSATVMLLNGDQLRIAASQGLAHGIQGVGARLPDSIPAFKELVESRQALYFDDIGEHEQYKLWDHPTMLRGWMAVPLVARRDVVGMLSVASRQKGVYGSVEARLVEAFAGQAVTAIENAKLFEFTNRSARELAAARDVLQSLNATPSVTDAFPHIANILKRVTGCELTTLLILDESHRRGSVIRLNVSRNEGLPEQIRMKDTALASDILGGRLHKATDLTQATTYAFEARMVEAGYRSQLSLPLQIGMEIVGSLNLYWRKVAAYDHTFVPLLDQTASALALALERSRLFEEMDRQTRQLAILNDLTSDMTAVLSTPRLCRIVSQRLYEAFGYHNISVFTLAPGKSELLLQSTEGAYDEILVAGHYRQSLHQGILGRAVRSGEITLVHDAPADPDFLHIKGTSTGSKLVIPIKANDRLLGAIVIEEKEKDAIDNSDVSMLATIADALATYLEKADLFEQLERRSEELETLSDISTRLRSADTVDEMFPHVLQTALGMFDKAKGSVLLIDPGAGHLVGRASYPPAPPQNGEQLQLGQGIIGNIATSGKLYICEDLTLPTTPQPLAQESGYFHLLQSVAGLPLRSHKRVVGVLLVGLQQPHQFSEAEIRLLTAISDIAGNALDRALVMATLEQRVEMRTRSLAEANERLQVLDELKSKFVSDVSHELRTPITNLSLYVDLLKRGQPEQQERYLATLRKQVDRLIGLIEDILSLSRLEMKRGQIQFQSVSLNELVQQIVQAYQQRAEEADLELILDLGEPVPELKGEPRQLDQVIRKLLLNALAYTKQGHIRISTVYDEPNEQVYLTVSDTGMGIAGEEQDLVFERFYRGQQVSQSNVPGNGLGLSIVKEIVHLHHGQVELTSRLDVGSTFIIKLPANGQLTS